MRSAISSALAVAATLVLGAGCGDSRDPATQGVAASSVPVTTSSVPVTTSSVTVTSTTLVPGLVGTAGTVPAVVTEPGPSVTTAPPAPSTIAVPQAGTYTYLTAGEGRLTGVLNSIRALPASTPIVVGLTSGGMSFDRDLRHPDGEGPRFVTEVVDGDGGLMLSSLQVSVTAAGTTDTRKFTPAAAVVWFPDRVASGKTNRFDLQDSGTWATVEQQFVEHPDGGRNMQTVIEFSGQITGTMQVSCYFPPKSSLQDTERIEVDVAFNGGRYQLTSDATRNA